MVSNHLCGLSLCLLQKCTDFPNVEAKRSKVLITYPFHPSPKLSALFNLEPLYLFKCKHDDTE